MATKIQFISELSNETYKKLPDYRNWTAFLRSAAWQYKYPFADQLMIYAQRPDATACANLSTWNNKLHRWINKGAKGIALPRRSGNRTYLDYVFDISDTNSFYGNEVKLWQYQTKHADAIIETLENTFGELEDKSGIIGAVFSAAHNAVEDSKADYISELKYARKNSFLEGLDSVNIDVEFQRTAENSVAYMILERMGIDADDYFTFEDFPHIMDFNTPDTLSLLGNAVSSISEQVLREIAATIRAEIKKDRKIFAKSENTQYNVSKDKNNTVEERTDNNVREHNLQTGGRLSNSRPQAAAGGQTDRQIRENEGEISETEQEQQLHNDVTDGNAERTSGGNRQDSNRTGGENSVADGESGGRERGTESRRPDEVDTADEQPQTFSGRNRVSGNSTQLSLFDLLLPTEETYNIIRENEMDAPITDELQQEQTEDYSQYIGREITDDDRKFIVDSINETAETVSLRDVTFQNGTGFPVFRSESLEWLKTHITPQQEQEQTADEPLKSEQPQKPQKVANTVVYPEIPLSERNNFVITDDELGYGGAKEKFHNNMEAIRVLKECEAENRLATPEEQEILSRHVGWGGLPDAFDESKDNWSKEYNELSAALTPEEYKQARASTLNAHYTSPTVIKAMYKALENMGFKQGNILEPSCGIGNFMGLIPDSMENSKIYGIEIDSITGRIAQQLYQKNSVAIQGYEDTTLPDSFFDVAVGNVPFGNYKLADKKYNKHNFFIHDYFFAKTLDKVRSGGIIAFITSMGTMDKKNAAVRKYIAQRADLLGAIRLPNNAFLKNAATQVTADIIFLQKRDRMTDIMPEWVNVGQDEKQHSERR